MLWSVHSNNGVSNMYSQDNVYSKNQRLNSQQLSKLHTFEVAARHGSFSLAAQELSMTPSAISHRINKLEQEMDVKLFERAHRKILLTTEGKRIYAALSRTLNDLNQEILDVKNEEISGTLTIYSRPTFAQSWLVPRIAEFKQRYPAITLKLLTGNKTLAFKATGLISPSTTMTNCPISFAAKHLCKKVLLPFAPKSMQITMSFITTLIT